MQEARDFEVTELPSLVVWFSGGVTQVCLVGWFSPYGSIVSLVCAFGKPLVKGEKA